MLTETNGCTEEDWRAMCKKRADARKAERDMRIGSFGPSIQLSERQRLRPSWAYQPVEAPTAVGSFISESVATASQKVTEPVLHK